MLCRAALGLSFLALNELVPSTTDTMCGILAVTPAVAPAVLTHSLLGGTRALSRMVREKSMSTSRMWGQSARDDSCLIDT